MSKYISFVFHQKSACQEVKPKVEEEDDPEYDEKDDTGDSDYSE